MWECLKAIDTNYGNLIQAACIILGFIIALKQLAQINRSTLSNAMHQISNDNRELMSLRLQYDSQEDTEEGKKIFPALITNHIAHLFTQYHLRVIKDEWWNSIKYAKASCSLIWAIMLG